MATRPPVPSKDAVRAMRSLALSTPLIFAGATGGACCLAAVHYDIRRRITLAEKIVRTKRTIHSVSTGKGREHVSKLLKAAEDGDDFLLSPHRSLKRRQRRKFSAVAVQSDFSEQEMMEMLEVSQATPSRSLKRGNNSAGHSVTNPNKTTSQSALGTKTNRIGQGIHVRPSKLLQTHKKMGNFTRYTFNTQNSHSNSEPSIMPRNPSLKSPTSQLFGAEEIKQSRRGRYADTGDFETPRGFVNSDQEQSDLNPCSSKALVAGKNVNSASDPFLLQSLASSTDFDGYVNADVVFKTHQRDATINGIAERISTRTIEAVLQSRSANAGMIGPNYFSLVPYLSTGHVPDYKRHSRPSMFTTGQAEHEDLIRNAGFERYQYIYHYLMHAFRTLRIPECLVFLERTLQEFMESKTREDLALVMLLCKEFRERFPRELWVEMMRRFIKEQLEQSSASTDNVALLYINSRFDKHADNPGLYREAQNYLEQYCDEHDSTELQLEETVKILKGTAAAGYPLHDSLLTPVVRSLCVRSETAKAETFVKDVSKDFGFEPTSVTLIEVVRGYARNRDWTKIDFILSQLHVTHQSRGRFFGFVALVQKVLEEYAQRKSPEQIYDFLTYYIQGFGLVPTSSISNVALDAFIRTKRYDLVRDWVRERQLHFPSLSPATSTNNSTITIGNVWHDMRASTEEILHACMAMAECYVRDPFSSTFRSVAMDAAFENVSTCLEGLRRTLPKYKENDKYQPAQNFGDLLESANQSLALVPGGKLQTTRQKLMTENLIRQMKAVHQLTSLFEGDRFGQHHVELPLPPSEAPNSKDGLSDTSDPDVVAILSEIPTELKKEIFPPLNKVEELLKQYYLNREKHGLPPNHNILRYVANKMTRQQREREALSIMETMYQSHWVQGRNSTPFDVEVFGTWIGLICQIRHPGKFMEVLWALIDSDVKLKITTRFFMLVRHTQQKVSDRRLRRLSYVQQEEFDYLIKRFNRRAHEEGCRYSDE